MSQLTSPLRHPVVTCVDELERLLDGVTDMDPGYLATADKADVLVRLSKLVDRVEGLRLRVMANAMDVADVEGAPTVAAWLAPRTRSTTRSLHGREQLARSTAADGRAAPGREGRRLHPAGATGTGGADSRGHLPRPVRRPGTRRLVGRRTTGLRRDPAVPARAR